MSVRCTEPYTPYKSYEVSEKAWQLIYNALNRRGFLESRDFKRLSNMGVDKSTANSVLRIQRFHPEQCSFSRMITLEPPEPLKTEELELEEYGYIEIEFARFWEIKEEYLGGKKGTPKIRFEIRTVLTVPKNRLIIEGGRVVGLTSGVFDYAKRLLTDAIRAWDSGGEIYWDPYYFDGEGSMDTSVKGWEDLDEVDRFNSVPTFTITKRRNGRPVGSWDRRPFTISKDDI